MTAIPSIWPNTDFNINISELSKNVGTVVKKETNEYRVSFKKPYKKLTYEGSWNADEKKPIGKGRFSMQTPSTVLDVTFNTDGTLNSSVKGTLETDLHIYTGFFSDVDTRDVATSTNIYIQSQGEQKSALTFKDDPKYSVYEGNFGNSIIQGQGTMTYVNGASNFGTWNSGRLHGQVIFNDPNMELSDMVGIWKYGKPITGFCFDKIDYRLIKESTKNKEAFYTGQWRNGKTLGKGQMTIKYAQENTIEKFIGVFDNYQLISSRKSGITGKHIKLYNNERKIEYYIGDWEDGEKMGSPGVQYFEKKTVSIYNGDWKDNKMEGDGICLYHLSKGDTGLYDIDSIYPMYIGKWKENLANGFGILLYNDSTQPVINDNKIYNIDKLRTRIGRWSNNKFIQGFELNPSSGEGEVIRGVALDKIDDGDIQYIHEGIQDIIKKDNCKKTFIDEHRQLAEYYINNILENELQGATFAEGEKMSIKDILTADEIREYQKKFQGGKKKTQRSGISGRKTRKKRKKKNNRTRICKKKLK